MTLRLGTSGSSPLSRGIRTFYEIRENATGIIPALAGNTPTASSSERAARDHPRSRGEYGLSLPPLMAHMGSSPLSRGIPSTPLVVSRPIRIIPALAGNTIYGRSKQGKTTDHPRSRGEYDLRAQQARKDDGSSPLSRGILMGRADQASLERIIPALAGNTLMRRPPSIVQGDHPRSRGEYRPPRAQSCRRYGSSPLSRGIPSQLFNRHFPSRIIPALAGNTYITLLPQNFRWDHPRSRGEYRRVTRGLSRVLGSSPLSRGIPHRPV